MRRRRRADLRTIGLAWRFRSIERHADIARQRRPAAKEAIDLFVYRIGRELGSLAGALGGPDALVFTGGIGEHAVEIRARCAATRNGSGSGSTKWPMPPAGRVFRDRLSGFSVGRRRPMRT